MQNAIKFTASLVVVIVIVIIIIIVVLKLFRLILLGLVVTSYDLAHTMSRQSTQGQCNWNNN